MANCGRVSDFSQSILQRKSAFFKSSQSLIWGVTNSVLFAALANDLQTGNISGESYFAWWMIVFLCVIFFFNICNHVRLYFTPFLLLSPIEVNEKQRKLMSILNKDHGFKNVNEKISTTLNQLPKISELLESTVMTTPPSSPFNYSYQDKSWVTGSPHSIQSSLVSSSSPYPNNSFGYGSNTSQSPNSNLSTTANSWSTYHNQSYSPTTESFNTSNLSHTPAVKSLSTSFSGVVTREKNIGSKNELEQYLKEYTDSQKRQRLLTENENAICSSGSLWSYNNSNNAGADLNSLKQNIYQTAIKNFDFEARTSKNDDDSKMNYNSSAVSKVWLRRNVTPKQLFQFEENLRVWLSLNVLQPVVKLIDSCNVCLNGLAPDIKIGNVGVDKLKKTAQNVSGVKHLNYLIPFLDMTLHQDYLIQRLYELSKGGAISAFRWNSGGSFNGAAWREEYPTDTYILLHLFATYMDNHLPPDPTQSDGRVFSNVHVYKTPEKPPKLNRSACLFLTQVNPPHVKLILVNNEEVEVGAGHKNFLHSLILFCHHLVVENHSQIAGVDLTLSGVNLAWVVECK